eukprot:CAMPEP_0184863496 /NCGR_PEP_ID=MMETSP0580-20130426/11298_1 /TAXON_ID=1118495 /ORGANISM="Dactyliosolen fragilissimus" /LENGTH=920 /DNA_ID=CAMNT_0027361861 /DNA_START=180 /DNA_END=2942 /DNA_ORIENTATION=+
MLSRQAGLFFLLIQLCTCSPVHGATDSKKSGVSKAQGPPPFFLQDPSDSLCLAGEEFRRCSLETLFFVVGKPGSYHVHKRPIDSSVEDEDGTCVSKQSCSEKDQDKVQDVKLAKCTHCGAKKWNILGDADTGYVLTEGEGDSKVCLTREKGSTKAKLAPCDSQTIPYTTLQLQFASAADIQTMESPGARLVDAASNGNKKLVQTLLKDESIDVNARDWDEMTALIAAASGGNVDVVKLLLKEGSDVNAQDKDGITALMEASIMGYPKIVDILIDAGAEVDAKSNAEITALWLASGGNKLDVMKILLKKHADATITRVDGTTALMTSSVSGHVEATQLLLDNGADPKAVDKDGLTALMNAAENGSAAVIKILMNAIGDNDEGKQYVDMISTTGFTAVIIAAAHGHTDAVKYLINQSGADAKLVHDNGVTSLMYAAASGHVETMKVIVQDGGVDVNSLHTNGGSALIEASTAGAADAIQFLIQNGANYDILDLDGVTPLMAIASQGNSTGLTYVLDALKNDMDSEKLKEHINLFAFSGGSAVMFSAAGGHEESTNILIKHGADVNAIAQATPEYLEKLAKMIEEGTAEEEEPHVDGVTALHVAAQAGHLGCVDILIEAGADVGILDDEDRTPLLLAVKGNYGEVASSLVKGGADPNTLYVDDEGESHNLLMDSIIVENKEFASLLIQNGADLYHEDKHKVTTLLQASHRGMLDVVNLLIEKHLSLGQKGKSGWLDAASDEGITPLIASCSEGHLEVSKSLVQAKVDIDAKDKDETNSLMAASARGHSDIVKVLLDAGAKVNEQNIDGHTALMFAFNGKNQVETLWERYNQFVSEAEVEKKSSSNDKTNKNVDDGGTGPIIRNALESHKKMVDLLIKSGADESIKDKEGHLAKDFDFHPDADADILEKEEIAEKKRDESKNEL